MKLYSEEQVWGLLETQRHICGDMAEQSRYVVNAPPPALPEPVMEVEGLPNEIDLTLLSKLLIYSDRYDISIQFWGEQIGIYISKENIDLADYGGDFNTSVSQAIEYLDRINGKKR